MRKNIGNVKKMTVIFMIAATLVSLTGCAGCGKKNKQASNEEVTTQVETKVIVEEVTNISGDIEGFTEHVEEETAHEYGAVVVDENGVKTVIQGEHPTDPNSGEVVDDTVIVVSNPDYDNSYVEPTEPAGGGAVHVDETPAPTQAAGGSWGLYTGLSEGYMARDYATRDNYFNSAPYVYHYDVSNQYYVTVVKASDVLPYGVNRGKVLSYSPEVQMFFNTAKAQGIDAVGVYAGTDTFKYSDGVEYVIINTTRY